MTTSRHDPFWPCPRPRAVCTIEDEGAGDPGGGAPGMPMDDGGDLAGVLGPRGGATEPSTSMPSSSFDDGSAAAADVFGRRTQAAEAQERPGDVAAALAAAAAIRIGDEPEGGDGTPPAQAPPQGQAAATDAAPPAAPPAIDHDALAEAFFRAKAKATAEAQRTKLEQAPEEPPPPARALAPHDETAMARALARETLGPMAEGLAEEDLDAIGAEQVELLRLRRAAAEYAEHPEHGPRLRAQLAAQEQRAYTRRIESEMAARDAAHRKELDELHRKVNELQTAPQRQQQETQIVTNLQTALAAPEYAQALPSLHRLATASPEKAETLARRIYAQASKAGGDMAQAIESAAQELEDLLSLSTPPTATAAGQTRPQARPHVTQRDAAGSPTRPSPAQIEREQWSKMSAAERKAWAMRGAEEERRRHAQQD